MRIKFKKGCTPKMITDSLLDFMDKCGCVVGSVNVYVQMYDEEMNPIKFDNNEYFVVTPAELTKESYSEYEASCRRSKMRAV
jgi:hypothetical protein